MATAAQLEKICRGVARVKREKGEPVCEERDRWVGAPAPRLNRADALVHVAETFLASSEREGSRAA